MLDLCIDGMRVFCSDLTELLDVLQYYKDIGGDPEVRAMVEARKPNDEWHHYVGTVSDVINDLKGDWSII